MPLYSGCSLPFETRAGVENRTGLYLETACVQLFACNLIPQGVDDARPAVTPNNASDLRGLPPTVLLTNGYDPLRGTGLKATRQLAAMPGDALAPRADLAPDPRRSRTRRRTPAFP